jgi:Arc/MetJ family transcription regulator
MGRTNIDIDDQLIAAVMHRYGLRTKREAVDLALRRLVGEPPSTAEILQLEGSGWDADLDKIRAPRVSDDR